MKLNYQLFIIYAARFYLKRLGGKPLVKSLNQTHSKSKQKLTI